MDNPRIGYKNEEGIHWPEQDLRGNPYTRPAQTTMSIGDGRFVVVPMGMTAAEIETALTSLRGTAPVGTQASRSRIGTAHDEPESNS